MCIFKFLNLFDWNLKSQRRKEGEQISHTQKWVCGGEHGRVITQERRGAARTSEGVLGQAFYPLLPIAISKLIIISKYFFPLFGKELK